jgi:drug/metabolite transporter (DMT)-like permease
MRLIDFVFLFCGLLAVSVADVLIKKMCHQQTSDFEALKSPLALAILGLYAVQITAFVHVFVKKAELGLVGIAQTVIYAIIVLGSGILFFEEKLTTQKFIGAALAIGGVALMNWSPAATPPS